MEGSGELREKLFANAARFRTRMTEEGFDLIDGEYAIVPVMFGEAVKASGVAGKMLENGVFVTAFSFRRRRHCPTSCAVESKGGRRPPG